MENQQEMNKEKDIILDGKVVTLDVLQEQQNRKDVRIIEVNPGQFKTLHRLQG